MKFPALPDKPGSSIARRLLVLFVVSIALPVVALSFVAYRGIWNALVAEGETRIQTATKGSGQAILGSLEEIDQTFRLLIPETRASESSVHDPAIDLLWKRARQYFAQIARIDPDGRVEALVGDGPSLPAPSAEQRPSLARGFTVIETVPRGEGLAAALIYVEIDADAGWLVGEVDPAILATAIMDGPLPPQGIFCLTDGLGARLVCGDGEGPRRGLTLPEQAEDPIASSFDWQVGDDALLASQWTIFLRAIYAAAPWRVVVGEPRSLTLAAAIRFRNLFPLFVVIVLGIAHLAVTNRLRHWLSPLQSLERGTRLIADGRFDTRVDLATGDEFESLADSFNAMAQALASEFDTLGRLIDLDRAILSSTEVYSITNAVLARIRNLVDCETVAVMVAADLGEDGAELHLSRFPDAVVEVRTFDASKVDRTDLEHRLAQHQALRVVLRNEHTPKSLAALNDLEHDECLVLPMMADGSLLGVIVLAGRGIEDLEDRRRVYARQVADQVAMALQNARTLRENVHLAYHDNLTGLPNRLMFGERLSQELPRAIRNRCRIAVAVIDLDGFKHVNDTLGHTAGDLLLSAVAERLNSVVRESVTARLGGDEFAILISEFQRSEVPAIVMRRALEEIARPFEISGQEVVVTASIGIAVYPDDGHDPETLVRNADSAMYHAKSSGRNAYAFYSPAMTAAATARLRIEADLRRALGRDELRLEYQPVVDLATGAIGSCEVLVRWHSEERGLVMPTEFISVAEETGLIVSLGAWILEEACRQCAEWLAAGLPIEAVAVNVSGRQIRDPDFLDTVMRVLEKTGLPGGRLTLELTETLLMEPVEETMALLRKLRRLGVRVSIDDFGTGYSSLSYLKDFQIDHLKIDRSFIHRLTEHADRAAITRAIVAMAHGLSLSVVAEGVETDAEIAYLRELGCDYAQGFHLSAPLPPDGFEKLLRESE